MKTWRRAASSALTSSVPTCTKRILWKSVSELAASLSTNQPCALEAAMRIAIIGAGAIGGYVGVNLALAGEDITVIVRGANLDAISANGTKLILNDRREQI